MAGINIYNNFSYKTFPISLIYNKIKHFFKKKIILIINNNKELLINQ